MWLHLAPAAETEGARFMAFNIREEPDWELSVLSACRMFDLPQIATLLGSEVPKPKTFGKDRTGLY